MLLTQTKTDICLDETIFKIVVHANYVRLYLDAKTILADIPVEQINSILIFGAKITIPGRLIKLCNEYQIPFHLLTDYHKHNGSIYFSLHDHIENRLEQFYTLCSEKWRVYLSKQLVYHKLKTQQKAIQTWSDNPFFTQSFDTLLSKIPHAKTTQSLMGIEGSGASLYWDVFGSHIPQSFEWKGRVKNPCIDPINSLLSFGYALLATQCQTSLTLKGLDPYCGILHKSKSDRPALVFDMMEIYRVLLVDLWVLALFTDGVFTPDDFRFTADGVCTLKHEKKNQFFKLWYKRLKYFEFSTNKGDITIHQFLSHNTDLLIQWFIAINQGKVRDRGKVNKLPSSLLTFKNIHQFSIHSKHIPL